MNMQKLLIYTKEELITYILKHRFFDKNIEEDMQAIHRQFLLEKDREFTNKEYEEEMKLLHQLQKMPNTTFEERVNRVEMYEKFKKLSDKNTAAYEKRQKEIDKLYREWKMKKVIYVSGKITGTSDYTDRFSAAEDRLNQMVLYVGWEAMNGDGE